MSQMQPVGGFYAQAEVPVGRPGGDQNVAIVDKTADVPNQAPGANTGSDVPVATFTSEPVPVSNENVAQVLSGDPEDNGVPGQEPGLNNATDAGASEVLGAVQALDAKIDGLISTLSPYVGAKSDVD